MFGIGFLEICVIAVFVLVFVGPQRLPELMKQAGKFFVKARRMSNEVRSSFDNVIKQAEEEVHLENIRKIQDMTADYINENVTKDLKTEGKELKEHIESYKDDGRDHSEFEPPLHPEPQQESEPKDDQPNQEKNPL